MKLRVLITLIFLSGTVHAATMSNLAEELIKLRSEIESIHLDMEQEREQFRTQSSSLNLVKSDLMASNQRLESELAQIESKLNDIKEANAGENSSKPELEAFFAETKNKIQTYISGSLPFKKNERLAAVDNIAKSVEQGKVSLYRGLTKLWNLVEDEMRLQSDVALYKQTIKIDGSEQLVDIAKVGMIAAYYKTGNDQYGVIEKDGSEWVKTKLNGNAERNAAKDLFDNLQKQIRTGTFTLPSLL